MAKEVNYVELSRSALQHVTPPPKYKPGYSRPPNDPFGYKEVAGVAPKTSLRPKWSLKGRQSY